METPLHSPPPAGRGVYWPVRQDWRPPILVGLCFIAAVSLALLPHFFRLNRLQNESFAAVSRFLGEHDLTPPPQRASVLSHDDDVFHWRGLAWKNNATPRQTFLFSVHVATHPEPRVVDAKLLPYDRENADALDVFVEPPAD